MKTALFAVLMIIFMFSTVGFLMVANHSDTLDKVFSVETVSSSKTFLFKTLEGAERVRLYYPESYQGYGKYNGYIENTNLYPILVHSVTEREFLGEIVDTIGVLNKLEPGTKLWFNKISHQDKFHIFQASQVPSEDKLLGTIRG